MTARRLAFTTLAFGVVLAACGGDAVQSDSEEPDVVTTLSHGDPDPEGTTVITTSHGPGEGWLTVFLRIGVSSEEVDEVELAISSAAPDARYQFDKGWLVFDVVAGHVDEVTQCYPWALPTIGVTYDPDTDDGQGVVDAVQELEVVVGLDAFGLTTNLPMSPEGEMDEEGLLAHEENQIACDSKQMAVYVDPSIEVDVDALITTVYGIAGVVGTAIEGESAEFFVPDLSAYPDLENCYGPGLRSLWVIFDTVDEAAMSAVIAELESVPGVAGFGGMRIDPALDPIAEYEEDVDWENCEGVEGYVELTPDITDEQAEVVVARASAVEGVADVNLYLVDPGDIEPCPESTDDVHYDCYVPTSSLTIYRGDFEQATPEIVSAALCRLPGVLSITVYDREHDQEFADPYKTCGSLNLRVYLDFDISKETGVEIGSTISAISGVASTEGPHFPDYESPEQIVVVGNLDPMVCLNEVETAPSFWLDLERVSRQEAESIADEILHIGGVQGVLGNAVGLQPWDPRICGYDGLSIQIDPDMQAGDQADLFSLFESRPDVQAVVHELTPPAESHEHTQWVVVKFGTDGPPDDLDALAAETRSIAGVVEAEVWRWAWGDDGQGG